MIIKFIFLLVVVVVYTLLFLGTCVVMLSIKKHKKLYTLILGIISPICIILFNLFDIGIVSCFEDLIGYHLSVLNDVSTRVAIDAAIVNILVNLFVAFLGQPLIVRVDISNPQNLSEIQTSTKRPTKLQYTINVYFRNKFFKYIYEKANIKLRILCDEKISMAVDKEEEYSWINSKNSSKFIDINLCDMLGEEDIQGTSYLQLAILSNKSVQWDSNLTCKLKLNTSKKGLEWLGLLLWELDQKSVK